MKFKFLFPFICYLAIIYNCEDLTSSRNNLYQNVFVYVKRGVPWFISDDSSYVYGEVLSTQITDFYYLKINDTTYDQYHYSYSSFNFGNYHKTVVSSKIEPLTIEVATSIGTLKGSINKPDSIAVSLSEYDTLKLNEPLTIEWTDEKADFYKIYMHYIWHDSSNTPIYNHIRDYVTDNSITYPASNFPNHGVIEHLYVQPINGPIPEKGSPGNMTGNGSGYLYYFEKKYIGSESIVVGKGHTVYFY